MLYTSYFDMQVSEAEPGSVYATPNDRPDRPRSDSQPIPPTGLCWQRLLTWAG